MTVTTFAQTEAQIKRLDGRFNNIVTELRLLRERINSISGPTGNIISTGSGVSVHAALAGLGSDDHAQYVHISNARTISAQHTFNPGSALPPFILHANAQGQLVTGFNADQLDGYHATTFLSKAYVTIGTDADLTGERSLVGSGSVSVADSGAGNNVTVSLKTPGTLTVSTTNDSAVDNHIHAITSSSNPGAAASILASDASGFLQLVRIGLAVAPLYPLHVAGTTEQFRIQYDTNNRVSFTVESDGTIRLTTATGGAGGSFAVDPVGDVIFNPTGNDVYPANNYDLNLGLLQKKWLTIHGAELWVETLVAQQTIATIGGRILVAPTTTLIADVSP